MSLDPREDFDNPVHLDLEEPKDAKKPARKGGKKAEKPKKVVIPTLPPPQKPLTDSEVRRGVSNRDKSAVNLKLAGASYQEIADTLDFRDAMDAKRTVERALAATHSPDDWETLRMVEGARAEQLFARSLAMASADFLVDEEGNRIPNLDKLRWHQQAAADLMNHALITGAKAPAKIEITPDDSKLEAIVNEMMSRLGHEEIIEADVIELTAIPALPAGGSDGAE